MLGTATLYLGNSGEDNRLPVDGVVAHVTGLAVEVESVGVLAQELGVDVAVRRGSGVKPHLYAGWSF